MPGGRPRLPTRVLEMRGTRRPDRHGTTDEEPQFEELVALPPAPGFFDDVAKMEWERIGPELIAQKLLTPVDLAAFTGYCLNVARVVAAERDVRVNGLTMRGPQGVKANPAVMIARQSAAEVRKFAQEFGMTPSARTRVRGNSGSGEKEKANPFAKVAAGAARTPA